MPLWDHFLEVLEKTQIITKSDASQFRIENTGYLTLERDNELSNNDMYQKDVVLAHFPGKKKQS